MVVDRLPIARDRPGAGRSRAGSRDVPGACRRICAGRISCPPMQVSTSDRPAASSDADTIAVGVFEGGEPPAGRPPRSPSCSPPARRGAPFKALALAHADGTPLAARRARRARRVHAGARPRGGGRGRASAPGRSRHATLCWQAPEGGEPAIAAALVEGTILRGLPLRALQVGPGDAEDGAEAAEGNSSA